jgi:hypothetical protein
MPALVNNKVGSFLSTIGAEGTISCPLDLKKSRKRFRISDAVMGIMGYVKWYAAAK